MKRLREGSILEWVYSIRLENPPDDISFEMVQRRHRFIKEVRNIVTMVAEHSSRITEKLSVSCPL